MAKREVKLAYARTNASHSVSSTVTADAAAQTAPTVNQHFLHPDLNAIRACIEPGASKRRTPGSEGAVAQQCAAATRGWFGLVPGVPGLVGGPQPGVEVERPQRSEDERP